MRQIERILRGWVLTCGCPFPETPPRYVALKWGYFPIDHHSTAARALAGFMFQSMDRHSLWIIRAKARVFGLLNARNTDFGVAHPQLLVRVELAYPVLASIIAIGFAIRGYWELRGQLWFWITISVFLVVHGVLIFCIPWRSGWVPAPVIMVFCIVDFAIILGVVGVIEKWKSRNGEKQLGQDTKY